MKRALKSKREKSLRPLLLKSIDKKIRENRKGRINEKATHESKKALKHRNDLHHKKSIVYSKELERLDKKLKPINKLLSKLRYRPRK